MYINIEHFDNFPFMFMRKWENVNVVFVVKQSRYTTNTPASQKKFQTEIKKLKVLPLKIVNQKTKL